jgi:PAS domain S-box-containing protein
MSPCETLLDALATPIFFKSPDGYFIDCNTAFAKFLGSPKNAIIGRRSSAIVSDKDADTYQSMDGRLLKEGGTLECETEFQTRSGVRNVVIRKSLIKDARGKPKCIVGEFFDITRRKQIEDALRRSNERYDLAIRGSNDGLWDWERITDQVYFSPRWKEIIGYRDHELPNHIEEWTSRIHPDDYDRVMAANDIFLSSNASHFSVEYRIRHKDGSYRWVLGRGTCLRDDAGHPYRIAGAHTDITQRKQAEEFLAASEQRFRKLLDQTERVAIQGYDESRRVTFWNRTSERLYGYSRKEALGQRLEELIIPEQMRSEVVKDIAAWFTHGKPIPASELVLRHRDGSDVPVFSSHVMQQGRKGHKELFCIDVDMSEIHAANRALVRAKEQAEEASRTKSRFLANMSHEIRTPLSGISSMLDLLDQTPLTDDQQSYMDMTRSACRRLTRLLTDILDLSKVEAGTLEIRKEPFDLQGLIESTRIMFLPAAERRGLTLSVEVDRSVPEQRFEGDAHRLQQILNNLVGNALKFTSEGTISVNATALPFSASPGETRLLFTVRDTGPGISENRLDLLFKPFVQGEDRFVRNHQGAGLGLSIVNTLIRLMEGTLAVESTEGVGTSFYLSVPFKLAKGISKAGQETGGEAPSIAGLRVLLAEDDPVNRVATSTMLAKQGITATVAVNGRQALDKLSAGSFDVILMDIQMPVMDGLEAAKRIRTAPEFKAHRNVPIIALTAYAMHEDRIAFLDAGMNDHLTKPVCMDRLKEMLSRAVALPGP